MSLRDVPSRPLKTDTPERPRGIRIFTIGHSNRSFEEFLALLKEFEIRALADIRRFPGSRAFPHFNRDTLDPLLKAQGIEYAWFENLGGFRHSERNEKSLNTGLESLGFRSYADYMMTDEFRKAVQELLSLAARLSTAIMCAERFYWKCHRRILSDFLVAHGVSVIHIIETATVKPHTLTPGAVIREDGSILYPSPHPE
jgi:uncharacterized protein (DUF488 family)